MKVQEVPRLGRFILFLLVFLSLYSGLHLYGLLKIKQAMPGNPGVIAGLAVFMVVMVFAPVIIRISESHGLEHFAQAMAYVGYTWMGLLFLFVSCIFVLDIYHLVLKFGAMIFQSDLAALALSPRHAVSASLILCLITGVYGMVEAVGIRTERVEIGTPKIPEKIGRFRIAQISDVHLGIMVGEKRLKKILDKVQSANPDILVSTGDLVDGQTDDISSLTEMLQRVRTVYGKFAVTGNHEYYAGLARSRHFMKNAGFTVLQGQGVTVSEWLNIVGVDDIAARRYSLERGVSEKALLAQMPQEKFTLLLKHRPVVDKEALGLFDLQLSGHTHNGQIFPFNFITMLFFPVRAGLSRLDKDAWLYVSRGSGTWGPPIRFMSPPEVTIVELVHEPNRALSRPSGFDLAEK